MALHNLCWSESCFSNRCFSCFNLIQTCNFVKVFQGNLISLIVDIHDMNHKSSTPAKHNYSKVDHLAASSVPKQAVLYNVWPCNIVN